MADTPPTVRTDDADTITRTTAKLHGTVLDTGTGPPYMELKILEPWTWEEVEPPDMEQKIYEPWSS